MSYVDGPQVSFHSSLGKSQSVVNCAESNFLPPVEVALAWYAKDILGYSDPLGTRENCHCKQIFAYRDTFWYHLIYQNYHCGQGVTVNGITVTKYVCKIMYQNRTTQP